MSGHGTDVALTDRPDIERFRLALAETKSFVHENILRLVLVSVAWFFASLPVVTLGVTTLGAYAAVHSLREFHTVDREYVTAVLRRHGVGAGLIGLFPLLLAGGTLLYLRQAANSGTVLPLILGLFGVYLFAHFALVAALTLVLLAGNRPLVPSLRTAYLLTVNHVSVVLMVVLVTLVLLVGTLALTVGFVLLFPTIAFSFHVLVVRALTARENDARTAVAESTPTR